MAALGVHPPAALQASWWGPRAVGWWTGHLHAVVVRHGQVAVDAGRARFIGQHNTPNQTARVPASAQLNREAARNIRFDVKTIQIRR